MVCGFDSHHRHQKIQLYSSQLWSFFIVYGSYSLEDASYPSCVGVKTDKIALAEETLLLESK